MLRVGLSKKLDHAFNTSAKANYTTNNEDLTISEPLDEKSCFFTLGCRESGLSSSSSSTLVLSFLLSLLHNCIF